MPGIHKMAADLQAWEWVYGRTPKFSICTSFTAEGANIGLDLDIKNGIVEKCAMDIPHRWLPPEVGKELCSALTGIRFCPTAVPPVVAASRRPVSPSPCRSPTYPPPPHTTLARQLDLPPTSPGTLRAAHAHGSSDKAFPIWVKARRLYRIHDIVLTGTYNAVSCVCVCVCR